MFGKKNCKASGTILTKEDKFYLEECSKTNCEVKEMQKISYALVVGILIYAQVCTCPYIAHIIAILG